MKRNFKIDDFKNKLKEIATKWKNMTELEKIPIFLNPYRKNFNIDDINNDNNYDSDAVSDLLGDLTDEDLE